MAKLYNTTPAFLNLNSNMIILKEKVESNLEEEQQHLNSNMIILKVKSIFASHSLIKNLNSNMIILKAKVPSFIVFDTPEFKFQYDNT